MTATAPQEQRYRGSHRRDPAIPAVLPAPPDDREKYLYADRDLPYLTLVLVLCFLTGTASQVWFETHSGMWPFGVFTALTTVAFGLALPFSFTGPGFDWQAHARRVAAWRPDRYPPVDIYLPICAEPIEVLRNTWTAVSQLCHAYPGTAHPYVLDDGADPSARRLASDLGFSYLVRPDPGAWKKAGNLRHAFAHTGGEFFVVLDADFAPRADFLAETLPYFDDTGVGIVQTPQYFRTSDDQTWVERAAGATQEIFYRAIQVARDRMGAAICVGTCAVYRRAALAQQGGPTQIAFAEDVHTGLDVRRAGWRVSYVPVLLATGICPEGLDMFVRQQYRWCRGAISTVLTSRLWAVPMTVRARLCYVSGLVYYAQTALAVFAVPLIPLCLLAWRPSTVALENSRLVIAAVLAGVYLLPVWTKATYNVTDVLPLMRAQGWAHALAFWDWLCGRTMPWEATGGPISPLRRFRAGVIVWDGATAAAWLVLAAWRTAQFRSWQFLVITVMGLFYAAFVCRTCWALRKPPA
jgi:cellulose synthase (UDP-forming)